MNDWLTFDEIQEIILNPTFPKIEGDVVRLLIKSRQSLSNKELFELQVEIANKIIPLEKQITVLRNRADRKTRNIEWLSREVYKAQRRIYKQVVDGLAWRYLNFKRSALRLLAEHHETGFLDKGSIEELRVAEAIVNRSNYFVIVNDLSEILKHGDLTIVSKDKVFIDEVKSSKTHDRRKIRQRNRADEVLKMLNTRRVEIDQQKADVIEIPKKPLTLLPAVEKVIQEAYSSNIGVYVERIAPYLWVRCVVYSRMADYIKRYGKEPALPKSPFRSSLYFTPMSNFTVFEGIGPNLAPYTIFPFEEEVIVDLMLGKIFLYVYIGEKELIESVKGKGWVMEIPSRTLVEEMVNVTDHEGRKNVVRNPRYFARLRKGNYEQAIPREVLLRISHEFLSIKSIVDMCEYSLSNAKPYERALVSDFVEEYKQWV